MKYCDKCKISIANGDVYCPLCDGLLKETEKEKEMVFPYVDNVYKKYSKFFKILYFLCASASIISVLVNIFLVDHSYFSLFVVAGILCLLLLLRVTIDNRKNMPKTILLHVFLLSVLSLFWDFITGFKGWSITYAIPIICVVGSVDMAIVVTVMNIYITEYLIYFMVVVILGLVPLFFLFFSLVSTKIPSLICIFLNSIVLLFMFILQKEVVFTEIKRRFHI